MSVTAPWLVLTASSLYRANTCIGGAQKTATEPAGTAWGRRLWPGAAAWVWDNDAEFCHDICQNKQHVLKYYTIEARLFTSTSDEDHHHHEGGERARRQWAGPCDESSQQLVLLSSLVCFYLSPNIMCFKMIFLSTPELQNLLQTKEREHAKAMNEINGRFLCILMDGAWCLIRVMVFHISAVSMWTTELKKKLRLTVLRGSEAEENLIRKSGAFSRKLFFGLYCTGRMWFMFFLFQEVETDFEQEIARLNTTGETEVALGLPHPQNKSPHLSEMFV